MTSALREATDKLSEILSEPIILIQGEGLARYRHAVFIRMLSEPWRVKAACLGTDTATWFGEVWWDTWEGGEDLEALEADAYGRLEGDLTAHERADVMAALTALDDFKQQRSNRA